MGKIKIRCEAIAKHSGKRCKCLGKFIPTSRRMLCPYHKGGKSWDNKTRKYKGLYKNDNINIQQKQKKCSIYFRAVVSFNFSHLIVIKLIFAYV